MIHEHSTNLVIIINGKAGVGKDTFVDFCRKYCNACYPKIRFKNLHRSDKPKKALRLLGWNGVKTPESRKLLAHLTNTAEQQFHMSTTYLAENLLYAYDEPQGLRNIVFYHVRDPKSIDRLVSDFEDKDVSIVSLFFERDVDTIEKDLWGIQDYNYDICIKVNTLEDSELLSEEFMENVISKVEF